MLCRSTCVVSHVDRLSCMCCKQSLQSSTCIHPKELVFSLHNLAHSMCSPHRHQLSHTYHLQDIKVGQRMCRVGVGTDWPGLAARLVRPSLWLAHAWRASALLGSYLGDCNNMMRHLTATACWATDVASPRTAMCTAASTCQCHIVCATKQTRPGWAPAHAEGGAVPKMLGRCRCKDNLDEEAIVSPGGNFSPAVGDDCKKLMRFPWFIWCALNLACLRSSPASLVQKLSAWWSCMPQYCWPARMYMHC